MQTIFVYLLNIALIVIFYIGSANFIGATNNYRNSKVEKRIDITKSKIKKFIPYCGGFYRWPWQAKTTAYFDGTVYKKTYISAIVNIISVIINVVSLVILTVIDIINCSGDIKGVALLIFWFIVCTPGAVFVMIYEREQKKYNKRQKEDGMKFDL